MVESCGYLVRLALAGDPQRAGDELADGGRNVFAFKRIDRIEAVMDPGDESVYRASVSSNLVHRQEVKLEVARVPAGDPLITLFGQHNLGDEPGMAREIAGQPWDLNAGHLALEPLEQAEEVPYRKHMVLHEDSCPGGAVELGVKTMVDQR